MVGEDIKKRVRRVVSLPSLPHVVAKIISLVNNPCTSARDINKIISRDPPTAARVLKLVNSAYYGFPNRIATITHAVSILGFDTLRSLALSASVFDIFSKSRAKDAFDRDKFWEHSTGCAVAAKVLARKTYRIGEEEAFVSGLLHDIGKLILDEYINEEFLKIVALVKKENILFGEAEKRIIGVTHAEIGRWLAEKWNLPRSLTEAIAFHHRPGEAKEALELAAIAHIADIISREKESSFSGDNSIPPLSAQAWDLLRLKKIDIEPIMFSIDEEMERAKTLFTMTKGHPEREEKEKLDGDLGTGTEEVGENKPAISGEIPPSGEQGDR